jgi:imidazolonepropionase-like amidohydrolase
MQHVLGMSPEEVLKAATSDAGKELGSNLLGTLLPGAPADLIAVPGDVVKNFKALEYPALVISGGAIIVNAYEANGKAAGSTRGISEQP